ncbi:MAG: hypothetical protein ABSG49_07635 [Methanoregula sp.]|jgi:hypothetical protein
MQFNIDKIEILIRSRHFLHNITYNGFSFDPGRNVPARVNLV